MSATMVDIDNFKRTNDTCGHSAGDIVLIQVAKRLERGLWKYDKIGRYGGGEMLVVLPGCGLHEAGEIAERLRLSVDGERIRLPTGELEISVTLGCSSSADFSLPTPEALVQASDAALYRGKKWGKNCVVAE